MAEAISLRRKYLDIVLAAKADMFNEAFRDDKLERHLEDNALAIGKVDEGQSVSTSNEQLLQLDFEEVADFLGLAFTNG